MKLYSIKEQKSPSLKWTGIISYSIFLILLIIIPPAIFNILIRWLINLIQAHLGEEYIAQSFHHFWLLLIGWLFFSLPWITQLSQIIIQNLKLKLKRKEETNHGK